MVIDVSRTATRFTQSPGSEPSVLDALPIPVLFESADGRVVGGNAAAAELFDCHIEALTGRAPRPDPSVAARAARTSAAGAGELIERPDGSSFRARVTTTAIDPASPGVPDEADRIVVLTDVVESGAGSRPLREAVANFNLFLEHAPAAIAMFDRDMRYLACSRRWIEDYRLEDQDIIGQCHYDVFTQIPERWKRAHRRCLEGHVARHDDDSFVRSDGRLDWVRWEIRPWHAAGGEIGGLIMFTEVVTEQKEAEEAVLQAQKMESLGILAGGVAHDFNNLLVAIIGQLALAKGKLPRESAARDHLRKADKAAERAADLTRQMLAYSGRGDHEIAPMDLNAMIDENLHLFDAAVPKRVNFKADLADDLPLVAGDAGQLQQVLMNLILNAADAIDDDMGTVTVSTGERYVEAHDAHLWMQTGQPLAPGRYVSIDVEDTGSGMNRETVSRIFDPFFSTKASGRGLGLAAVLGIVRDHGGGLTVYSEVGRGSTFKIVLPVREESRTRLEPAPGTATFLGEGIVMVVDDEDPVREAVTELLEDEGFGVLTAADGVAAVELFKEWQSTVGVVLLDLSLPGMGGEQICRELKAVKPDVKILLSSGYSAGEATRGFEPGDLCGFIQKPYQPSELTSKVHQVFIDSGG